MALQIIWKPVLGLLLPNAAHLTARSGNGGRIRGVNPMNDVRNQSTDQWLADYESPKPHRPSRLQVADSPDSEGRQAETPTNKPAKKTTSEPKFVSPEESSALIPEGWYTAKCFDYKLTSYFSNSKVTFSFVITEGRHMGTKLECFFNLDREITQDGEEFFRPSKRGHYLRMMKHVFDEKEQAEPDWLAPRNLIGKVFRVEVDTVTKNNNRESLGSGCQYSKIKTNFKPITE
jgi:hypothetical protein